MSKTWSHNLWETEIHTVKGKKKTKPMDAHTKQRTTTAATKKHSSWTFSKCLTSGIPYEKASLHTLCYLFPGCLHNIGLNSIWAELVVSSAYGQTFILIWVELVFKFDTYQLFAMFMCMVFVHDKYKATFHLAEERMLNLKNDYETL